MNIKLTSLIKAVLAGVLIGIAATIYLNLKMEHEIIGATLFAFGLLTICGLDYKLYTGRVGYIIDNKPSYIIELIIIILGNIVGVLFVVLLVRLSNMNNLIVLADNITQAKLSNNYLTTLILSFLCGIMMYLGVDAYKRISNDIAKVIALIMAVIIFILSGFEHSIANIFYFGLSSSFSSNMVISFIIMLVGNGLGGVFINGLEKLAKLK